MKNLIELVKNYQSNKRCKKLVKSWEKSKVEHKSSNIKHVSIRKAIKL